MDAQLPPRPKLTTLQKLRIMARYCRCPGVPERGHRCGNHLGKLDEVEWDHIGARVLTADDSEDNFRPLCIDCHQFKTTGRKGERFVTSAGSDIGMIRKADRLADDHDEFRARLLRKEPGKPRQKTGTIRSRGFPKNVKHKLPSKKAGNRSRVERRDGANGTAR